ncbi:MAG: TrbC family F-type conjugative pilus assembly protein [Desulfobaccales bacterium]
MKQFEEAARDLAEKSKERAQKEGMEAIRPLFPEVQLPEKSAQASPDPKTASVLPFDKDSRLLLFITLGPDPDNRLDQNRGLLRDVPPGTEVVLRGLPHGKRGLGDLFRYVHKLTVDRQRQGEKMPQVLLDPRLYQQYQVDVSPTLVYERKGKAVAWVRGLVNSQWLKDQVEKDRRTGDLGKYGPTEVIAERDFLEEIQERLASIDWDARKEKAWENYWTHYSFLTLPPASKDRVYQVEAVYEVPQDYGLPNGKILARKGDKINLFDKVKPHFVLLVFDGSDPRQLAWAKEASREYQGRYRVQYLTTGLPERTWQSYSKLEDKLEAPLYLLNDAVRDRFRLEHAPAIVRPLADRFEVREICLKNEKDQGGADAAPEAH